MTNFEKYLDSINEGKIVIKRKYTDKYPEKNVRKGTTVRNAIIEALRDKKLTLSEFKEIVSKYSKSPNKWTQRNKRFFKIEEDNVSLSTYGSRIAKTIQPVNEGRKEITKKHWDKADDDQREEWLLQAFSDPDDAIEHVEKDWEDLPSVATSNMYESVSEGKDYTDYGLSDKFSRALDDLDSKKFNTKDITALAKKHKQDPEKAIEYASTAFEWLWKESVDINEGKKVKPFRKVKPGDIAVDYNDEELVVYKTGPLSKLLRWDDSGAAEDGLSQGYLDKRDDALVIEDPETHGYAVYTYGDDGAVVYESVDEKVEPGKYSNLYYDTAEKVFKRERIKVGWALIDKWLQKAYDEGHLEYTAEYVRDAEKDIRAAIDKIGKKNMKMFAYESVEINERAKATQMLKDVIKGFTTHVEGIKLSKEMAEAYLDWLKTSAYGKRYVGLPFNHIFQASFNWGIDRYTKHLKKEYKELKQKAKEMKESTIYTSFSNFVNESYMAEEEVNEAFKSSKLRNLLNMKKSPKSLMKGVYGATKIALDKVEDHQIIDVDPKQGPKQDGYVFYYTTQEKENPHAVDDYYNAKFPANTLLALAKGKKVFYVRSDWSRRSGSTYTLTTDPKGGYSRHAGATDIGPNKSYSGYDASGLGSLARVISIADAAFVINPDALETTHDKIKQRSQAKEGAIAFKDPKEFKEANLSRYREILTQRSKSLDVDKEVIKAIEEVADIMKNGVKNQKKNKYNELIMGTGKDGRDFKINDLTNFTSNLMSDYERWSRYMKEVEDAKEAMKSGDDDRSQYTIKWNEKEALTYSKSIKDRLKKLKNRNLAW